MKNWFLKTKNLIFILLGLSFCIVLFLFIDILTHHKDEDDALRFMLFVLPFLYFLILLIFSKIYKRVTFQSTKIEKILNSQKNILIVTNGSELIEANRAFLKFFSYETLEDFKKEYRCICDHFIKENGYLQTMMGSETWAKYLFLNPDKNLAKISRNGNIHIFKVFVQKIDEEKELDDTQIVVTFEDITEEERIKKEINEQKIKLQNTNNSKASFLANISHELRTPLNSIVGFSKLLFDTRLEKEQYEILKKIDNSSTILINTIDSILEISKIDTKKIKLAKNNFTFDELVKDIEDINLRFAINSTNKFILNKDVKLNQKVVSDKARILQLLTNFISNAYKFTKNGEIKLDIKLLETLDNNKIKVLFNIKDTGIGIAKVSQSKIFDEFFQDTNDKDYSGNGLGLAISRSIITAFDSSICLESELNKGSNFSFMLILKTIEIEDEEKSKYEYPIFENINILTVDDNEMNRELLKRVLEKSKISVTIAKNGKEAVDIFEKNRDNFDLILMDLQMPIMDGFKATKKIRELDKKIPIVAITASNSLEDKQKASEVLINEFLSKPIDTKNLYKILQKYITKLQNSDIKYKDTKSNIINNTLNRDILLKKVSNDEYVDKILRLFLNEINTNFTTIIETLTNNEANAKFMIHSLKGLSGNISANNLFRICAKIDEKFKMGIEIDFYDIKLLKEEIENIKKELAYLDNSKEDEKIIYSKEYLGDDILEKAILKLKDSEFLEFDELKNIYSKISTLDYNGTILEDFKFYIEDFEYEKAKEILEKLIKL